MKKKLVSSIIFLSIIFFVGCQRNYTGNNKDRENLKIEKKENNISEKYLAKQGKASLQLEKYADKEGYIIGESTKYKGQVLCIMKKVKEESILKNKIFEQRNGKIKCIFEFI